VILNNFEIKNDFSILFSQKVAERSCPSLCKVWFDLENGKTLKNVLVSEKCAKNSVFYLRKRESVKISPRDNIKTVLKRRINISLINLA